MKGTISLIDVWSFGDDKCLVAILAFLAETLLDEGDTHRAVSYLNTFLSAQNRYTILFFGEEWLNRIRKTKDMHQNFLIQDGYHVLKDISENTMSLVCVFCHCWCLLHFAFPVHFTALAWDTLDVEAGINTSGRDCGGVWALLSGQEAVLALHYYSACAVCCLLAVCQF